MNYNLSDKLKNQKPTITIDAEHTFEVNNFKETAFEIDEIVKNKEIADIAKDNDKFEKVVETALGEEALTYIKGLHLSISGWNTVLEAITAAVQGLTLEEVEKEAKKAAKDFRK